MTTAMLHRRRAGFFGHPPGLGYLALTEAWERFSFSGMQTLLVLYMVGQLLQPGHVEHVAGFGYFRHAVEALYGPLAPQPLASVTFGLYTGLVFLMPVFGGIVADRWIGQHRMVMLGAVLMALGHFAMAFETAFLAALALLVLGAGCLKGNISTQVANLYASDDRRRGDAFQIFSIGINSGIIIAPLICGTLGELWGWHYGFAAAGVGMMIGLSIYIAGQKHLPPDRRHALKIPSEPSGGASIGLLCLVFVLVTCFLTAAGQLGNVYNLWLKTDVDRRAFTLLVPVTWFHVLTPLFSSIMTPLVLMRWKAQALRGRDRPALARIGFGLALSTAAMLWLASLSALTHVSWLLLLPMHLMVCLAYVYVWPVGLDLFSRAAPSNARAMVLGLFFVSSFVASNLVGWLGRFYETLPRPGFWLLHAGLAGTGTVLALIASGLRRT